MTLSQFALSPFPSHCIELTGIKLHYVDEGQGELVVMLHGNPTWSFFFRELVKTLRSTHRVIAPDHIGCGLSDKPGEDSYPYTLARRIADLETLLDQLQLKENITLVLHDWGGMIGMGFAHLHPERIKRLVILNTAAFHLPANKRLPWSLWLCRNTPLGPLLVRGFNAFCRGAARFCAMRPLPPEVRAAYLAPYDSWKNRIAVYRFVRDIPLKPGDRDYDLVTDIQEGLARFRHLPMLICWGERDFVFDRHFLAEWALRFPDAEVHTFPDAGHYVLEDAGAAIGSLVVDFMGRTSQNCGLRIADCGFQSAIRNPQSAISNIAGTLSMRAKERPHAIAIIEPRGTDRQGSIRFRHFTFRELDADSNRLARGLQAIGIGRDMRVVLMVPPGIDFYSLTFALFKMGAVIVLIDPGMGTKNLGKCLQEAVPQAFIGVGKAHLARRLLGWGRDTIRTCVTVGRRFAWGGWTLKQVAERAGEGMPIMVEPGHDETAAILFTSGSTGVAKGVVYTHAMFNAQVEMLRMAYGIEPGEVDLPTFPLFGLFGPALGMTAVIPEMDATRPAHVDPEKIIAAIRQFAVTNLFGSPALVRRVGEFGAARGRKLATLRRVISAGAPVPVRAIESFQAMLPDGAEVHTPYGVTEGLPVCSIASREILGETWQRTIRGGGVCVGRPLKNMAIRIIQISEEPIAAWSEALCIPRGEIGEIVVRGPVVSRSYFNRPSATALAKIYDTGGGFWHRMGDVGYLDNQGRLWFCGRKSQRVMIPNETLFTIPYESIFNAHPAVRRTALVGVSRNGETIPVLCVERDPAAGSQANEALRAELLALGAGHALTRNIKTILFHPAFPVDIRHNAKIFREQLAVWAARKLP